MPHSDRVPINLMSESRERRNAWRMLRLMLWPRDRRFFVLFNAHAELCVDGLRSLVKLLGNVAGPDGRVGEIEAIEKRADGVVDEVRALLRRSLFPPFSRVVVYGLINRLDDVLDVTEDAAQSVHLYHITQITPDAVRLAELAVDSMVKLQAAVARLASLDDPRAIRGLCAEVDTLEAQADHVMRAAMSKLFREEADARQIVKLKAVYELLESLTDICKDVANEVEAIVLKHG
jgi:predicted phosphate transport protein (TIGR00153 family)